MCYLYTPRLPVRLLAFAVVLEDELVQRFAVVAGAVQRLQEAGVDVAGLRDHDVEKALGGSARSSALRLDRLEFVERQSAVGEHASGDARRV